MGDETQIVSNSSNLKASRVNEFERLLTEDAFKVYNVMAPFPQLMVCSVCGAIDPAHKNHHFCDYTTCKPPHDKLFVVEPVKPMCFCKAFTPGADGTAPPRFVKALAGVFNIVAATFKIHAVQMPAVYLVLNHPEGVRYMLGLYFFVDTTREHLNAMFDTDAFTLEGEATPNSDWSGIFRRVGIVENGVS